MSFTLPNFNLSCSIWRNPTHAIPPGGPPDVVSLCNLAYGKRTDVWSGAGVGGAYLLLPALTDIRGGVGPTSDFDTVEVPNATGRFYFVVFVEDAGKGFPNEHRVAILQQQPPWPFPTP